MGRVVAVLLEGRDRDLLVVRVVLEAASAQRNRFHIGAAVGAGLQIGVGGRGRARRVERYDRLAQVAQQRVGRAAGEIVFGGFLVDDRALQFVLVCDVVDEV